MPKIFSVQETIQRALLKAGYNDSKLEQVVFAIIEELEASKQVNEKTLSDALAYAKRSSNSKYM